jgi:hypothetical protein
MTQERGYGFGADLSRRPDITNATVQRRGRGANFGDPAGRPLRQVDASGLAIDNWAHLGYIVAQ